MHKLVNRRSTQRPQSSHRNTNPWPWVAQRFLSRSEFLDFSGKNVRESQPWSLSSYAFAFPKVWLFSDHLCGSNFGAVTMSLAPWSRTFSDSDEMFTALYSGGKTICNLLGSRQPRQTLHQLLLLRLLKSRISDEKKNILQLQLKLKISDVLHFIWEFSKNISSTFSV